MANFSPALYNPAQAVTLDERMAESCPAPATSINGLIRAGNGVPSSELGRVPGGDSALVSGDSGRRARAASIQARADLRRASDSPIRRMRRP